jgi:chemotaxis protein methyltransferase CheR
MSLSTESFGVVCKLARQEAALELGPGKEYLVLSRLEPVAKDLGLASVDALVHRVQQTPSPQLKRQIVEALTTHETLFFRDNHPFEALRSKVLPAVLERRRPFRSLRILSAACSTGQEPHTLSMILWEHFPEVKNWQLRLLATDFSERVLERAREAKYRQLEISRGLPAVYLSKYFKRAGAEWQLCDELRRIVEFRQQNITAPWLGLGPFDLILVRNVLIYFSDATKTFVLSQAASSLDPQGFLLLGAAESMLGLEVPFRRVDLGSTTAYQLVPAT